jgi:hypothetical protein
MKANFFTTLKIVTLLTFIPMLAMQSAYAQPSSAAAQQATSSVTPQEQEVINLSKQKWLWMAERKMDSLDALFHEKSMFVHMSRSMTKAQELEVIRSGGIQYKKADIHEVSVNIIGNTAILLNKITLLAVVRDNEVTNPFVVTEVYVQENNNWKLASLSFTRLVTP